MDERQLLRISLFTAIVSMGAIALIGWHEEPLKLEIADSEHAEEGEYVTLAGTISAVQAKEGFTVITLSQKEEISVIAFDNVSVRKGEYVMMRGKTQEYEGRNQIVAERIIKG